MVFFSFWLSHVPGGIASPASGRSFAPVLDQTDGSFIENRDDPTPEPNAKDPYVVDYGRPGLHRRRLQDGREYRVLQVIYEPDELQALVTAESWDAAIEAPRSFIFGSAWSW